MEMTTSRTSQTLVLPDGRTLGFAEYGIDSGPAIFFFHGFPEARLSALLVENEALKRGLHIIAPDRPGFGLSSPKPNRTMLDHATDVQHLARHLGLVRFAVLGVSGGGPYALACAYALPPHMLTAVGLLISAPMWEAGPGKALPPDIGPATMPMIGRVVVSAARRAPTALGLFFDVVVATVKLLLSSSFVLKRLDAWIATQKQLTISESLSTEARRKRLIEAVLEPFAQGSGGAVTEAQVLPSYWGFKLEEIPYKDRILFWHGRADTNAPIDSIRYMAATVPNAELKEYDATHYTMHDHLNDVLDDLQQQIAKHGGSQKSLT